MANKQSLSKVNLKGAELQQMIRNMPVLKSVKHEQQDVNGEIKNMMMVFGESYGVIKSQQKKLRDDEKKLEAAALLATYRQGLEATQTEDDFETLAKGFDEFIKADFDDAKGKEFWLAHGQDILDANKADTEKLREIKSVEFGKNSLDQLLFNAQNMIALAPNGDKYLEMGGEEIAQSVFLSEAEKEKYRESFYKNGILNLALQDAKKAESFRADYLPDDEGLKGEIEKIAELRVKALEQQKQKSAEQEKFDAQKEAVSLWQRKEKGELDEASYYVLAKGLNGAEIESEEENFDVCEAYRLLRQINAGERVDNEEIFKADKGLREAYQRGEIGFEEVKFAQNFMFNKEGQNNRGVDRAINELMDRIMLADVNEDSDEARVFMEEKAKLALQVSEAYYARKNELISEAKEQGKTISLGVLTACARKAMHEVRDMFDFAEDEEGISFAELENELEENYPNADKAVVWKEFAKRAPYARDKSGLIKRIADVQNGIKLAENEYAGVVSDGSVDKGGEEENKNKIFNRVFLKTIGEEGGYESKEDKIDAPTNMGIRQDTLDRFRKAHPDIAQNYPKKVKNLTYEQVRVIARMDYFDAYRIGEIEYKPLQEIMFDSFFNHSPEAPALWAQKAINYNTKMNIKEDGIFGSETINAMNSLSWEEVVKVNNAIVNMRQNDYENEKKTNKNPHYKGYTKGLPDRFEKFRIK